MYFIYVFLSFARQVWNLNMSFELVISSIEIKTMLYFC